MNYNEFVDAIGLTLAQAKEQRDEYARQLEKAELGFKLTLVPFVAYVLTLVFVQFSELLTTILIAIIFIAPIVATIIGGFKRLWKGAMDFTLKGYNLIPLFPINFVIAMGAFFLIIWAYMWVPFLFFWKMKKNIKFDLEVAEDVVKDLEAKEQAEAQGNIS